MTWLGLLFSLLITAAPDPLPADPAASPDPWEWAGRLGALRTAIAKPPVEAEVLWAPFAAAPSPVPEEAALLIVSALPEPAARRTLLRRAFPQLADLGAPPKNRQGGDPGKDVARWLTEDSCTAPARLAVFLEWIPLLPVPERAGGWELVWDTFPGHPDAFSWLLAAVEAARAAEQHRDLARLSRVQLMFLPHTLDADTRQELRASIPCARRENYLRVAAGLGAWDALLELVSDCPDPAWEARARYHLGDYTRALEVLGTLPAQRRPDALELRLASLALPADQLAERYAAAFAKDPGEAPRRRLVKTRMLAGQYDRVVELLEKDSSPQSRFLRALAAWHTKRTALARGLWATPAAGEDAEERLARQYWLAAAGGPDELPTALEPTRPVHAYYLHTRRLPRLRPGGDTVTRALPVLLPRRGFSDRDLARVARGAQLSGAASLAYALVDAGFPERQEPCLQDALSMRTSRHRSQLDLWRCPHFVDGHPERCPQTPVTASDLPALLAAWTAAAQDWPVLQGAGRPFLPQPHQREIVEAARRFRVPAALLWAVMQTESSFHPRVISRASAIGLFQVIPPTGRQIAAALGRSPFHPGSLLVPATAVEFGAHYLRTLADEFGHHWPLVVAAYNGGPHQVRRWLKRPAAMATDAWVEEIPFEETRRYVKLVLGRAVLYARQVGEPPPVWPLSVIPP